METSQRETQEKKTEADLLQLVGFNLGREEFGVDILMVQEINRMLAITQVPRAPGFVEGVINLRGRVIPIISLRKRFGLPKREHDKNTRVIVVEIETKTFGMVVDGVNEVLRLPKDTVEPPPPIVAGVGAEYISGIGKLDGKMLILLDLSKLMSEGEKETLRGMSAA